MTTEAEMVRKALRSAFALTALRLLTGLTLFEVITALEELCDD